MTITAMLRAADPAADLAPDADSADARRLLAQILATRGPRGDAGKRRLRVPRRVAIRVGVLTTAACIAVAAVALSPGASDSRTRVTLAAYTTPAFPLTIEPLPAGLAQPIFSGGPGTITAVYPSSTRSDDLYVGITDHDVAQNYSHATGVDLRSTAVGGHPGSVYTVPANGGAKNLTLVWQRQPGQWVVLTGNGRNADDANLQLIASRLVDQPQQVPLQVHLAPAGWTLQSYKDNTIITLRDPDSSNATSTLTVNVIPALDANFASHIGAKRATSITVDGRSGQLAKAQGEWILETTSTDGSAFRLQAPIDLTSNQVIQIAAGITVTPHRG